MFLCPFSSWLTLGTASITVAEQPAPGCHACRNLRVRYMRATANELLLTPQPVVELPVSDAPLAARNPATICGGSQPSAGGAATTCRPCPSWTDDPRMLVTLTPPPAGMLTQPARVAAVRAAAAATPARRPVT